MLKIDGESLTPREVDRVSKKMEHVELSENCFEKIENAEKAISEIVDSGRIVYGINTGFGKLSENVISKENLRILQKNLVLSHASGTGEPLEESEVRSIILTRANTLAKGFSGVRKVVIEKLLEILNKEIYPWVPSFGSLGASGDLAPLSHIALLLLGEGKVFFEGKAIDFKRVLDFYRFTPLEELLPKEGLALINGTAAETGIAALIYLRSRNIFDLSIRSSSLSIEALRGKRESFDFRLSELRNFPEGVEVSKRILSELEGSKLVDSEKRVQDAYTIRCIPSVYGSVLRCLEFIEENITRELNAVTDNPVVFPEEKNAVSGGNFHGEMIAFSVDMLSIALSEIGNITERRINRLLNTSLSGLPPFLAKDHGLNSGMMILQYTVASLVSMNKILAHPASVDSIPVSADQEDHVSMGMNAVLKASKIIENLERIIAIELIVASQAVDFLDARMLGKGTSNTYRNVRSIIDFAEVDREFSYDIERIYESIKEGSI